MEKFHEPIQQLNEIRNLMERSSRFISLSGLSGISAGIIALIGAAAAYFYLGLNWNYTDMDGFYRTIQDNRFDHSYLFLIADALLVLILALTAGIYFTTRKARHKGLKVWDNVARRMLINLMIPLVTGGLFCMILIYHRLVFMIAPATLIFYGLALINASKYTFHEIRVLGISEIILGLIALWLIRYGLICWAAGFGILHILYGLIMYYRYETNEMAK